MNTFIDKDLEKKILDACEYGQIWDVEDYVLNHNALYLESSIRAYKPLHASCINDSVSITRFLLKQGVPVNSKKSGGTTAIMIAASNGKSECLDLLIESGADINCVDDDGKTALMEAIYYTCYDSAIKLIELGAETFIKDNRDLTALDYFFAVMPTKEDIINLQYSEKKNNSRFELFCKLMDKIEAKYNANTRKGAQELIYFYTELIIIYPNEKHGQYIDYIKIKKERLEIELEIDKKEAAKAEMSNRL